MIARQNDKKKETRENMRGGAGRVEVTALLKSGGLPDKCRLFSELMLEKGCGIGGHTHENETELFYVLSGKAVYNDNGVETILSAGEVAVCPSGEFHAVRNELDEPLVLLAVIILN